MQLTLYATEPEAEELQENNFIQKYYRSKV
jgi:hypothetical protein